MSSESRNNSSINAFVTLLTSDHYLPGALVLAESLRLSHGIPRRGKLRAGVPRSSATNFQVVALITPDTLSVQSIKALRRSGLFDWIVGVEPIGFRQILASSSTKDAQPNAPAILDTELNAKIIEMERNLGLLGRPDLTNTLTKLHAWRLGRDSAHLIAQSVTSANGTGQSWQGFDKVVFLDADTLVLRPIDHLFNLGSDVHFAAAPDTGWPDAFNSGVMMLTPSTGTFDAIRSFARSTGSWDGADQGLLNDFFGPEEGPDAFSQDSSPAPGGGWKRLSFRYNVTSHGGYTFAPAYQRYGSSINVVHFIGQNKPWNRPKPSGSPEPNPLVGPRDLDTYSITPDQSDYLLALWHSAFASLYPSSGSTSPDSEIEIIHTERGVEVVERRKFAVPTYHAVWDAEAHEENSSSFASDDNHASPAYERASRQTGWEAAYVSIPLDGRTSLIAPAPEVERSPSPKTPTQQSVDAELRDRQHDVSESVKPAPAISIPIPIPGRAAADEGDDSDDSPPHCSPPKLAWNPAHEPPPIGSDASLYQMRVPIDSFYSNVWDSGEQTPRTLAGQKAAFFVPPQSTPKQRGGRPQGGPGYIPAQLRRDRVFDNLGSHQPDPSKVKPIFPWEAKQQREAAPTRVFPDEPRVPSPSPVENPLKSQSTQEPVQIAAPPPPAPAPRPRGLPANLSFVNAWDQEGAIGNFAKSWSRRGPPASPERRRARAAETAARGANSRDNSSARPSESRPPALQKNGSPTKSFRPALGSERRTSMDNVTDTHEGEASDSRDGDDESSSDDQSSDREEPTEVITSAAGTDARGNTPSPTNPRQINWPREGPGKGYMRKAESSAYAQMHATPRSPRMTSRVLSYASTATEGEGRSGGGRFSSSSSSASNTTITNSEGVAARQRARDRIRPDGWISAGSGSGMSSPPQGSPYHPREMNPSSLRGIPGSGAGGVLRGAPLGTAYAANMGRRREGNSSNESQSGESGANSPTALLSPALGSSPYSMGTLARTAAPGATRTPVPVPVRSQVPVPPSLDEPFSSSPVNLRSELSQQARTHHQARAARNSRSSRPA